MESQPQNPEFRINPENFYPCQTAKMFSTRRTHWTHIKRYISKIMARKFRPSKHCQRKLKIHNI